MNSARHREVSGFIPCRGWASMPQRRGVAVANSLAAVVAGVKMVQGPSTVSENDAETPI